MDETDKDIVRELKENGRATASQISRKISLSIPAVAERIKKLEQTGVIEKYTVKISRNATGQRLLAFIFVNIERNENIETFRKSIIRHPNVLECHHMAGSYDYLLKVITEDTQSLERFLTADLKKIKGVAETNTLITLTTLKEEINAGDSPC